MFVPHVLRDFRVTSPHVARDFRVTSTHVARDFRLVFATLPPARKHIRAQLPLKVKGQFPYHACMALGYAHQTEEVLLLGLRCAVHLAVSHVNKKKVYPTPKTRVGCEL